MQEWEIKIEVQKLKNLRKSNPEQWEEKIKDLFLQYEEDKKNKVKKSDSWARTILILANEGLIKFCLQCLNVRDLDGDEYSIGKLGLINAIDKYDINQNSSFPRFAIEGIKGFIKRYFQGLYRDKRRVEIEKIPFSSFVYLDEEGEKEISLDLITYEDTTALKLLMERNIQMIENFKYLTPKEQYMIIQNYGLCGYPKKSLEKIGEEFGISRSRTGQIIQNSLRKLKLLMTDKSLLDKHQIRGLNLILKKTYPILEELTDFYNIEYGYSPDLNI